jgi:type II secretory pathway component PulF
MTMAKGVDPRPPGWDEPPIPLRDARPGGHFQKLSLRNMMIALVYFAMVFWVGRNVVESGEAIQAVFLGVLIGLGLACVGMWAAMRMKRYAFIGWILFILGYMIVTASTISAFAIPSVPILIGAIIYLTLRRRSTNQDALLWVLNVAADRGMPLAPGVQAFSSQATGIFQVWTQSLAELLRQGVALPDAIESLPKTVSPPSSFLIRIGYESGELPAGLREATLARSGRSVSLQGFGARIAYLCGVLFIAQAIVGFVLYFIIPKFEAIFQDFGVELPQVTIFVIGASHLVIDYFYLLFFPFLAFVIYLPFYLYGSSTAGLPLIDRLFPRRHTILILRGLAVVIEAGRPIAPAFRAMAQWYPIAWVRRRLEQVSLYVEEGVDWAEALHARGLLTGNDVGLLQSAGRAGNLPWALHELAESGERRRAYRLQVWSQLLFVVTILILGFLIFLIAVAFFMPLTTLILRLSQ